MRQPLWLINASLVCIILISEFIFLFIKTSIPKRAILTPGVALSSEKKADVDADILKIYGTNDLFGTYVSTVPELVQGASATQIQSIPDAPEPIPFSIPAQQAPVFIAPIAATLKGVIYLQDDSAKSVAIIQMSDSKQEHNYYVGEMVLDAQILKIFPNRVIIVRSNGQQETLYLRTQDLEKDFENDGQKGIEKLEIYTKNNKRYIPVESFLKQVTSLAKFIDMLEIRNVYQKGKSVGCRICNAAPSSLADRLGFEQNDLVKMVDFIVVQDLNSRIEIYDHICDKKIGDEIVVGLQRDGKMISMTFVLSDQEYRIANVGGTKVASGSGISKDIDDYKMQEDKKRILEQKIKLAPTAQQIKMDEQKKLIEARKKNMLSNQHFSKR